MINTVTTSHDVNLSKLIDQDSTIPGKFHHVCAAPLSGFVVWHLILVLLFGTFFRFCYWAPLSGFVICSFNVKF